MSKVKILAIVVITCGIISLSAWGLISLVIFSSDVSKEGDYVHPDFVTEYTIEEHIERIKQRTKERFANEISSGEIVNFTVDIVHAFYDDDPEYFLVELEYKDEWIGKYANEYKWSNIAGLLPEKPEEYVYYSTKYKHFLGKITNDWYHSGIWFYQKFNTPWTEEVLDEVWYMQESYVKARESYKDVEFMDGRSAYSLCGYGDAKKYYGSGIMAIEKDEQIIKLFDFDCLQLYVNPYEERFDNSAEFHTHYNGEKCKSFTEEVIDESIHKELMSEYTNLHKEY